MRTPLAALLCVMSLSAYAGGSSDDCNIGTLNCTNGGNPTNSASLSGAAAGAKSSSRSDATGVGVGLGEGGDAAAIAAAKGGTAISGGNEMSQLVEIDFPQQPVFGENAMTITEHGDQTSLSMTEGNEMTVVEGDTNVDASSYIYREVKQAPVAIAGGGNNTASCVRVLGIGGSFADDKAGGISLGIPMSDDNCALDKAARMAFEMGNPHAGWRLYCAQPAVMKAYKVGLTGRNRNSRAQDACLAEAVDVQSSITQIEATQNVYLEENEELRRRVEFLESAAHRPFEQKLLIDNGESGVVTTHNH